MPVTVAVTGALTEMVQEGDLSENLGWSANVYEDFHPDGTQDLRWLVRMLDYDEDTGEIIDSVENIDYVLSGAVPQ